MAKSKKETNVEVEETVEVQEAANEEPKPKKEAKKEAGHVKKVYLKTNTPYVLEPTYHRNIDGILNAYGVYEIEDEIFSGENGNFYKIDRNKYINQSWDVEVF